MQNEEKLMQTFMFYFIYMNSVFLIPQMSSSVSKSISQKVLTLLKWKGKNQW